MLQLSSDKWQPYLTGITQALISIRIAKRKNRKNKHKNPKKNPTKHNQPLFQHRCKRNRSVSTVLVCSALVLLWQIQHLISVRLTNASAAEFAVSADLCGVEQLFGKDFSCYEILKACGVSGEISTPAMKQDVSPVESSVPLSANVNKN